MGRFGDGLVRRIEEDDIDPGRRRRIGLAAGDRHREARACGREADRSPGIAEPEDQQPALFRHRGAQKSRSA
jgi:hypothetical protein